MTHLHTILSAVLLVSFGFVARAQDATAETPASAGNSARGTEFVPDPPANSSASAPPAQVVEIRGFAAKIMSTEALRIIVETRRTLPQPDAVLIGVFSSTMQPQARLWLLNKDSGVSEPLKADGRIGAAYRLPALDADAAYEIVATGLDSGAVLRPIFRSEESSDEVVRLGDLRAQCQLLWKLERRSLGGLAAIAMNVIGGPCASSLVEVWMPHLQPFSSAVVRFGERSAPLQVKALRVRLPSREEWPDEALVHYQH